MDLDPPSQSATIPARAEPQKSAVAMPHNHATTVVDDMGLASQPRAAASAEMLRCQTEGGASIRAVHSMQHATARVGCTLLK